MFLPLNEDDDGSNSGREIMVAAACAAAAVLATKVAEVVIEAVQKRLAERDRRLSPTQ